MVEIDSFINKFVDILSSNEKTVTERREFFSASIEELKNKGYTRNEMFRLIQAVLSHAKEYDEEIFDLLGNYYTGITGDCASVCVEHFADDPDDIADDKALQLYVRSQNWKKI